MSPFNPRPRSFPLNRTLRPGLVLCAIALAVGGCSDDFDALQAGDAAAVSDGDADATATARSDATDGADQGLVDAGSDSGLVDAGSDSKTDGCVAVPREICNGVDDTCDDNVDEGCPSSLGSSWVGDDVPLGASTGGAAFTDHCDKDEVLIGLRLGVGSWLDQIAAVCSKLSLRVDRSTMPFRYTAGTESGKRLLAGHPPSSGDPPFDFVCPPDQILVALQISQQSQTVSATKFTVIPSIWLSCGTLVIEPSMGGGPLALAWRDVSQLGPVHGLVAKDADHTLSDDLRSSAGMTVPVGIVGNAGNWLDRVGLSTGTLLVIPQ